MKLSVKEMAIFGICAGLLFAVKKLMEPLPNIHPVAIVITILTVCYRQKALYPIYTYVLLEGLFGGFNTWWLPYLYIWAVLWGAVMLLPRHISRRRSIWLYGLVCGLHGLSFGVLYAPFEMLLYGWSLKAALAWIAAGFTFDCIHGVSNLVLGTVLCAPLIAVIRRIDPAADKTISLPKK